MGEIDKVARALFDGVAWQIMTDDSDLTVDQRVELVAFMAGERDCPYWFIGAFDDDHE